ncbi:MAG: hypothetical protein HY293_02870 [Planctomycetes bacterium]|nr:hypothetical protein [Planctomycetota bacterium]
MPKTRSFRVLIVAPAILAALSQAGCIALYHAAGHHHDKVISDVPVGETRVRQVSASPVADSEELKYRFSSDVKERPVILASATRKEVQEWELKETREVVVLKTCDGVTADTYLVAFTVGLPCLMIESCLILPLSGDLAMLRNHEHPSEQKIHSHKYADGPGRIVKDTVDVRAEAEVELALVQNGSPIPLGRDTSTLKQDAELRTFGTCRRPLRDGAFEVQLRAGKRATSFQPSAPEAFLASVQGADWSVADVKDAPSPAMEASASFDAKSGILAVEVRLSNPGPDPLYRFALSFHTSKAPSENWIYRVGKVAAGPPVARRLEVPADPAWFSEPVTLTLEAREANQRTPRPLKIELKGDKP